MNREFKPGVAMVEDKENLVEETKVEDVEFTEEETKTQLRINEEDLIQGLIEAADALIQETQRIEIAREGKVFFSFRIRPLSEREYDKCKKRHTKYVRNRTLGMKMPDETDQEKYRAALIYEATVKEDRDKLWDNKKVWDAFIARGLQVVTGYDVIIFALKAGEKEKVLEAIDKLSGYDNNNLEEVTKN